MFTVLAVASLLFNGAVALKDIPERARSGIAGKRMASSHVLGAAEPQYWKSKCDNFNAECDCTFLQKYYVDATYWDGKGPVFYEIGGEGTLSPPGGYVATLASNYSALMVTLEHRFYGDSIPNGNANTDNYRLLTVEQALADLDAFTTYYTALGKTGDAPWFVFGGSYPGALASWYRIAYPASSVGSLSSSGVVNCIIDYDGFDKQVSTAVGNQCGNQIRRISDAYERMVKTESGWNEALTSMHCEADMWKEDFFYMIADSWSMVDQYSAKDQLCSAILSVGEDASDALLTKTFSDFSNAYWGTDFCSMGFYNTEQLADPSRWDINSRSWRWQTCHQVSYFNTAPKSGSLRASMVDLDYHLRQCRYAFGLPDMFPSSMEENKVYGADIPTAHKVFYSDFSDDPWLRASVDYPVSADQPFFMSKCDNCGHCKDLHTPTERDPEPLKQSRVEFEGYLAKWLEEADGSV